MNPIIWYKCPNCYEAVDQVALESMVQCKIQGCQEILCDHCFINHALYCHPNYQTVKKLSDVDLEKYRVFDIHG